MKERIITALCLIAVVVPAVVFGGIFYKILIAVVMGLSIYEMLHICSRPRIGLYMYFLVGAFFVGGFLLSRDSLLISNYLILVYMACVLACMILMKRVILNVQLMYLQWEHLSVLDAMLCLLCV